jgi:glycine cleavage system aminomethyltransferase T
MAESLEAAIQRVGSPVELLRNSQYPAYDFPVRGEWSNWRSEQLAWRESVVLLDQSHHMSNLFIKGPDALKALSDHGVNTFANFGDGKAKQFVAANEDGHFVGDGILFGLGEDYYDLVANATVINWMQFHAETGDYNITIEREDNSNQRAGDPRQYRYELQGPHALPLVEKLLGGPAPDTKFFHMADLTIARKPVRALRHGMAGQPGFEVFGPWSDAQAVLEAILEAGQEFGLKRGGARAYATANLESGWLPRPFTAIFGPNEKAYREWLPATAVGSLGGSFVSSNIADYYHTPYDIGYGKLIKFDHDFVGRDALEKIADGPHREKVNLVWNTDDVLGILRSQLEEGTPAKFLEFPKARYAYFQVDQVLQDGKPVGMSTDVGYITNERVQISIASLDASAAEPGTEVTVLWGENPNTTKPAVEPHRQVEVRATVAPMPYAKVIRDSYRKD